MDANPDSSRLDVDDDNWVNGSDVSSNDSSFYGDEDIRAKYEDRVAAYNPTSYWDLAQWDIQRLAAQAAQSPSHTGINYRPEGTQTTSPLKEGTVGNKLSASSQAHPSTAVNDSRSRLYNPYEGERGAKQLSETVEDFLSRAPPSSTSTASVGPWIWVANPHSPYRPTEADVASFKQEGSKTLAAYLIRKSELELQYPSRAQSSITRMLGSDRDFLETRILDLAKRYGVTCGKWMLFPSPQEVDSVWAIISRAVIEDQLGSAAKVATNDGDPSSKYRLVCIYTVDFSNLQDVKRVLGKMRQIGLLKASGDKPQVIYYKCDAYTHLDIANGNEYKLKASMYNSRDLLSEMRT